METANPSLLGLPTELVVKIIDDIPPEDHLNFALTSIQLHEISSDVLETHRKWHRSISLSSDLHPLSIPRLLEHVLLDPIAAWHIRDLELWTSRRVMAQWAVEEPEELAGNFVPGDGHEPLVDKDDPGKAAYVFTQDGLDRLKSCFINRLGYDKTVTCNLIDRVLDGEEKPLKLLILALAPALRSLKIWNAQ